MLQSGEAADLARAFGGAGSQTAFGPRGAATFLSKATTWCAIMFMLTSMAMTMHQNTVVASSGSSVLQQFSKTSKTPAPAVPVAPVARLRPLQRLLRRRRNKVFRIALGGCFSGRSAIRCFITSRGSGGTGRRTILRGWRRKAWGFESPLPHQLFYKAHRNVGFFFAINRLQTISAEVDWTRLW